MYFSIDIIEETIALCVDEAETEKRRESNFALAESLFDE